MKKTLLKVIAVLCVYSILFSSLPLIASGTGGRDLRIPPADPTRSPDFVRLTNRGNAPPQFYESFIGFNSQFVVLEGRRAATGIGSSSDADAWDFTFYINNLHVLENRLDGAEQILPQITHEVVNGTEKAVLLYRMGDSEDPLEEAAKRQEQQKHLNDAIRRIAGLPKDDALRQMETERVPFPQTAYMADFTIKGNGSLTGSCQDGVSEAYGMQITHPHEPPQYVGAITYHVALTIDGMDYARAVVTFSDSAYGLNHTWVLEGHLGVAQPQKPPQRPKPPKKPEIDWDDPFAPMRPKDPPEIDPNDPFAPLDTRNPQPPEPDPFAPMDARNRGG